jgi:hypothetical protein
LNEQTLRFEVVDEAGVLCPPADLVAWLTEDHGGAWSKSRGELYEAMQKRFGCSERTAKDAVAQAKREGLLKDEGQRKPLTCVDTAERGLL